MVTVFYRSNMEVVDISTILCKDVIDGKETAVFFQLIYLQFNKIYHRAITYIHS